MCPLIVERQAIGDVHSGRIMCMHYYNHLITTDSKPLSLPFLEDVGIESAVIW
jgi:hypothetical protein